HWIEGRHAPHLTREPASGGDTADQTDGRTSEEQTRSASEYHSRDRGPVRTQCEANADLPALLRDGGRHHAVDADNRQRQSDDGKHRQQHEIEAWCRVLVFTEYSVQRHDRRHRLSLVDG